MYGYNTKFFSKDFLDSFKKSVNESLTKGNGYGIGVNNLKEDEQMEAQKLTKKTEKVQAPKKFKFN